MADSAADTPSAIRSQHHGHNYTCSQPLLDMEDIPVFPSQHVRGTAFLIGAAPTPNLWTLKFLPEQWVYTDGFDITGHPRLGAAVVHIPSSTTIYIDVAGT